MESRRDLRVVPSNGHTLTEDETIRHSTLKNSPASVQTCPKFNNGLDCRVCGLSHACSTCLREDHDARSCKKGILRASSGNIGSNDLAIRSDEYKCEPDSHYGDTVSRTLVKLPEYSNRNAIRLEHRRRRKASDSYNRLPLSYRSELLSPRYNAYRAKARSKGSNQTWPDHLEEAFQEALRLYPCRGRKKEVLNGKQSGGNEFITNHIYKRTGIERCRKQVSSHIQVLKGYMMKDNPAWMRLVAANGYGDDKTEKKHGDFKREDVNQYWESMGNLSDNTYLTRSHCLSALTPSSNEASSYNHYERPTIRRVEFAMQLYKGRTPEVIHKYTSLQCATPSAPRQLEDLQGWRTFFPPLAEYHDQSQMNCPIFLFETNLSLMEELPACAATISSEICLEVAQGVSFTDWQVLTRFYEEGGQPVDLEAFYKGSEIGKAVGQVDVFPGPRPDDANLKVPLKSKWWATTFTKIMNQNFKARATDDAEAIRIEDENTERYIRGISVMQEIYASARGPGSELEKVVILLWKFDKARKGETATTSWRRLNLPPSPFQVQSPTSPQPQPLLTLDTTLEHAMVHRSAAPPYADYYNSQQQPSIFVNNAEEILDASLTDGSSPETTPPSDYNTSFPSSTSSSFPSNISNTTYPLPLCPQSSFDSQTPLYPSLDSFDSQDSAYHSQEIITHTQDLYDPQESIYHSHETFYRHHHHDPNTTHQVFDWSTQRTSFLPGDDDDANLHAAVVTGSPDFTSGKIHISYPPPPTDGVEGGGGTGAFPIDYEDNKHLLAPTAHNMATQHQLIQHPEHFAHHDFLDDEGLAAAAAAAGSQIDEEQQQAIVQQIDWQLIAAEQQQQQPMHMTVGAVADAGDGAELKFPNVVVGGGNVVVVDDDDDDNAAAAGILETAQYEDFQENHAATASTVTVAAAAQMEGRGCQAEQGFVLGEIVGEEEKGVEELGC